MGHLITGQGCCVLGLDTVSRSRVAAPLPDALLAARQQWRTNPVGVEKIFSALDLVEDLDMLADIDVDQAMLQTVEAYLPGRISSLVFAYARSRRAEARQLALSLAESPLTAREHQTVWLRAWVAGVAQLQEGAAAEALSALRYGHVELHRDLVLAALDQVQQKPTDARCERLLDEVWKEITPDAELTDVYKYCRGESLVAGQALSKWGATCFVLALRAGASFDLIPADLANLKLDHPDPWWLLTALSPTADLLEAIARLDSSCRAVFGLTSIQEREELAGDVFLRSTIEECRRGRPLY